MSHKRKTLPYLGALSIYVLALALVSVLVLTGGLRDGLLYLLTVPIILSAFFYDRRVYLTMSILLTGVGVWITSQVSSDFQASLTSITVATLSILMVTEIIYRLVTARLQAEEQLRQSAAALKARNDDLDAFAHTVAHDLQNPLTVLIGFAEVLEEDCSTLSITDLQRYLHTVAESGRKIDNIINELLLLSGVSGMKAVEIHSLKMQEIVAASLQRLTNLLEKNQVEISTPASWPVTWGYAPWIEEVWVNYVSNAIKYGGQPPRVELGADVSSLTGSSSEVRFWVRDNGAGLTPAEQEQLFIPFTQLNQVCRVKGHGLGLSIVQRIISKLGGQVGVESKKGEGSTFYFTLPRIQPGD